MRKLEKKSITRGDTRFNAKLEELFALKLPKRFANTSIKKSTIELLGLENLTKAKKRWLPSATRVKERKLLGITKEKEKAEK